jgi:hypothetical protein
MPTRASLITTRWFRSAIDRHASRSAGAQPSRGVMRRTFPHSPAFARIRLHSIDLGRLTTLATW